MVEHLTRSQRRWKRIAIAALSALVLAVAGWTFTASVQRGQIREAMARAEQAERDAERSGAAERQARKDVAKARSEAEWALYSSRIQMAEKEIAAELIEKAKKP